MSEFDDIGGEETDGAVESAPGEDEAPLIAPDAVCLSCGAGVAGVFCVACGQKQDDLRRSLFVLARDFIEDTFAFDSRMWRTLGLLAVSPGLVPTNYSHGQRSRYTPPVRLFLVVSFLFFLTIGLTNTLFIALEVTFRDMDDVRIEEALTTAQEHGAEIDEINLDECSFISTLRFFIKEADLQSDHARIERCIEDARLSAEAEIAEAKASAEGGDSAEQIEQTSATLQRGLGGLAWAIQNPRAFNDGVNDWLPRLLFMMTPLLALILALFLRRDVLIFDHVVLSLYVHAVSFTVISVALILTQFGAPLMGLAAFLAIAAYYTRALKHAYGRGWRKTVWTAAMSGLIYLVVLMAALAVIVSTVVWNASA